MPVISSRPLTVLSKPEQRPAIQTHLASWIGCKECPLCRTRSKIVLGRGYVPCDILFIGEAPGESEDSLGQPFVGPAGEVLDSIITEVGKQYVMSRKYPSSITGRGQVLPFSYFLSNLIACLPLCSQGQTRQPSSSEIKACSSRVTELIQITQPLVIVSVGALAEKHIPKDRMLQPFPPKSKVPESQLGFRDTQWIPQHISIKHPSWMLQYAPDFDLEFKRAVLTISEAIGELVPF